MTRAAQILADLDPPPPDHLLHVGRLRLQQPTASLEELAVLADLPMIKDALAGRLRMLLAPPTSMPTNATCPARTTPRHQTPRPGRQQRPGPVRQGGPAVAGQQDRPGDHVPYDPPSPGSFSGGSCENADDARRMGRRGSGTVPVGGSAIGTR